MIINTKEFQAVANTILYAVELDKNAANLELTCKDNKLMLSVTNREYFVAVNFEVENPEPLHVVVAAPVFLNLIAGLSAETFELEQQDNVVIIRAGKSQYKTPMIYENEQLMTLPVISIHNKLVEMPITVNILKSILNINSKEIQKVKNLDVDELRKLYYIDKTGCFTFTTGACLNSFDLEQDVKLLLNDKIVKLFKLFNEDVWFSYGCDAAENGLMQHKAVFETNNIYIAALVTCDDVLLNKFIGPYEATKAMVAENYSNKIVVAVNDLAAAINRLLTFTKNSSENINMRNINAEVSFTPTEMIITDEIGNVEAITVENGSFISDNYSMKINISDLKLVIDAYKNDHVTINCGTHKAVVINNASVNNLLMELA